MNNPNLPPLSVPTEYLTHMEGLTQAEAEQLLTEKGLNELPGSKPRSVVNILLGVLKEPMFLLLLATVVLYLILGNTEEGIILSVAVLVVIGITFFQERKTERALDALRELSSPHANVIRDGKEIHIDSRQLVAGDLIRINEGEQVPADAVIIKTRHLAANEAVLTGESVAVGKTAWNGDPGIFSQPPGGENKPLVYSGTMIVSGQALARVYATGTSTELGKIGKSLSGIQQEDTLLNKEVRHMVRTIAYISIVLCIIVVVVYGMVYHDWLRGVLAGLTLSMALLPEEFPVVLTIFLALGAWRIARKSVLTREISAIETLGAATVLCSDKTGTITENKMSVHTLYAPHHFLTINNDPLPENVHALVEYAVLASQKDPFDPMEKAIKQLAQEKLSGTEHLHTDWELVKEYPFTNEFHSMSEVWKARNKADYIVAAKGSPEAIFQLCRTEPEGVILQAEEAVSRMAADGLRVLGVASVIFNEPELPTHQRDFAFGFMGLIGLADPIRENVPQAVAVCYKAGVRVVMITGDSPATAKSIARQIGLRNPDNVVTGMELANWSEQETAEKIRQVNVFSRVVPEQKLKIVNALKSDKEVVCMTGDGVNDAPALKAAHIGIAMGQKGTDVAREAADLVLLNDNFTSIVTTIRMGRRIFGNLQKAMSYIVAIHVPIAGLSLLPLFSADWPIILSPVHIAFLELVIDPVCSIVFEAEPEDENVMEHPPRGLTKPLFGLRRVLLSAMQGFGVLGILLAAYFVLMRLHYSKADVSTIIFCALMVANLTLILANRSWERTILRTNHLNKTIYYILGGFLAFFLLIIYVPAVRNIFHFAPIHPDDLLICLVTGGLGITWFEVLKLVRKGKLGNNI